MITLPRFSILCLLLTLTLTAGVIPAAAAVSTPGTETEGQFVISFVSAEYVTLVQVLLILLIVLLLLVIIYLLSTLLVRLRETRRPAAGIKIPISKTTLGQLDHLMENAGEHDREAFVRQLITDELTGTAGTVQTDYIRQAVSSSINSPQVQERLRQTIAEILMDDSDTPRRIREEKHHD